MMKKWTLILLLALCTSLPVAAQPDLRLLWSDHLPELYDSQNAAWSTPTSLPPGAVHWKYDQAEAQAAMRRYFPRQSQVMHPIRVVTAREELDNPALTVEKVIVTPDVDVAEVEEDETP